MKNWKEILEGLGIEIPEGKEVDLKKSFEANYKTINEFSGVSEKLKDANAKVETLEADKTKLKEIADKLDGINPDDVKKLQEESTNLKKELADRDAAEKSKSEKAKFEAAMDAAVGDKKFANGLVKKAVYDQVASMHAQDQSKGLADLLEEATKDTVGVWNNPHQDPNPVPTPRPGAKEPDDNALRRAMGLPIKD